MRKKVDARVRTLIENGVALRHRSLFIIVGDAAREQVVNLHFLLSKAAVKARPSVLWCYKKELGFTSHRKKRMKQIKKMISRGLLDPDKDDPFELFISSTSINYCYYKDSARVLGNTFGMLVLQDFEAVTPNVLARTIETVEGGGLVVLLLKSMASLQQLYTMSMDAHARFRTEAHAEVQPRFNERFILSLASCTSCLVLDDELNVLPISSHARAIAPLRRDDPEAEEEGGGKASVAEATESAELTELKISLRETQPVGSIVQTVRTVDQAKAVLTFVEAAADKTLRATVALTAGRGRGKSAALGLSLAAAIGYGYANIFVTAPSPENLRTLFEFVLKGLEALEYKEHTDFNIIESTNPELRQTVVRVNVFREHRQTIQYIEPADAALLAQAELLVIDEAAAIPLPQVRALFGPYLVFMASTVNGYEGTGRALSLKLIQQLRAKSGAGGAAPASGAPEGNAAPAAEGMSGRSLREVSLEEPIRYGPGDPIEKWLHELLCLDAASAIAPVRGCPHPSECELYWVDRDALFSYHSASEAFLQRMIALCVASHYKNTPNDLQLMSDAPAHQLFVLLAPVDVDAKRLPDILAVIQLSLEGDISKASVQRSMARGEAPSGDMIPWTMAQQFQESDFAALSGARVVRIAVHPEMNRMGYGTRALQQLLAYYQGEVTPLKPPPKAAKPPRAAEAEGGLLAERLAPRAQLPPLLLKLAQRPPEPLHWVGASFGVTESLFGFWHRNGFKPVYVGQRQNEITGEHSLICLRALDEGARDLATRAAPGWLPAYSDDFRRRLASLLSSALCKMPTALALSLLDPQLTDATTKAPPAQVLDFLLGPYDLKRLNTYARNLADYHLVLDLVPLLARLRFSAQLKAPLSPVQAAILLGLGLQHKSVDQLQLELGLPVSQILALFNKLVRRMVGLLQAEHHKVEAASLPAVAAAAAASSHLQPLEGAGLEQELEEAGVTELEAMRAKTAQRQADWLASDSLARYEVQGGDEEWEAALGAGGGAGLQSGASVAVKASAERKQKEQARGGNKRAKR